MKKIIFALTTMCIMYGFMIQADPVKKRCSRDSDCNDGNACTIDRCDYGTCKHENNNYMKQSCYEDTAGTPLGGTPGKGACHYGSQVCSNGAWTACTGATGTSAEVCGGGDEDCDGIADEDGAAGCVRYYSDKDGDGFGISRSRCLCKPEPPFTTTVTGDCDDENTRSKPGGRESCSDEADNDCDGTVNEENEAGCETYYSDKDRDGYGISRSKCLCKPEPPFTATGYGDCDDESQDTKPGIPENCSDGIDNNCNGQIDGRDATCTKMMKRPLNDTLRKGR